MSETARCILVVEDEWLLADQLATTIREAGHHVLGPAARAVDALALLQQTRPDAAMLDVSLGGGTSFPVAAALASRGVPFLFLTGYAPTDFPSAFRDRALLRKPLVDADIGAALMSLLRSRPAVQSVS